MSDRHVRRTGADYQHAFMALLPQGEAWPRQEGTLLYRVCAGLSAYWGYVDSRAADLLEIESDPRRTFELLPDWERNWGLPDPCYQAPQNYPDRIAALIARMTLLGAQSREFYMGIAAGIGYPITITEYRTFVVGIDRVGDARVYGAAGAPDPMMYNEWGNPIMDARGDAPVEEGELSGYPYYGLGPESNRFYWTVHVQEAKLTWFRCASGECGIDPHLRIGLATDLECLLNRWKPGHTEIVFDYSLISPVLVDPPVITGTTTIGSTLTSTHGNWVNNPVSYTYQWQRNRVNIEGQTASTHVVTSADIGTEIVCDVTATSLTGVTTASSNPLNIPWVVAVNTAAPVISGTTLLPGGTLSCSTGTWLYSPTGYTYQWKRGGVNIGGATASTYLLVYPADGNTNITCAVTAINLGGSSAPATSNALATGTFATLDGATTNVTLSNGNLTATHSLATNNCGARSTSGKNSGKWYFEVLLNDLRGNASGCGLITPAGTFTDMALAFNSVKAYRDGSIYVNGPNYKGNLTIPGTQIPDGSIMQWCFDLDTDKFWVSLRGTGIWNDYTGGGTANPATGVGGISCAEFSGTTLAPAASFSGGGTQVGSDMTFNFGATPFAYPVPAGFTPGWIY